MKKPYAEGGAHRIANGLSLRSDLHRVFDSGYVTIDEQHRFVMGRRLREDFENGRSCHGRHGQEIAVPGGAAMVPDERTLEWHRGEVFLG